MARKPSRRSRDRSVASSVQGRASSLAGTDAPPLRRKRRIPRVAAPPPAPWRLPKAPPVRLRWSQLLASSANASTLDADDFALIPKIDKELRHRIPTYAALQPWPRLSTLAPPVTVPPPAGASSHHAVAVASASGPSTSATDQRNADETDETSGPSHKRPRLPISALGKPEDFHAHLSPPPPNRLELAKAPSGSPHPGAPQPVDTAQSPYRPLFRHATQNVASPESSAQQPPPPRTSPSNASSPSLLTPISAYSDALAPPSDDETEGNTPAGSVQGPGALALAPERPQEQRLLPFDASSPMPTAAVHGQPVRSPSLTPLSPLQKVDPPPAEQTVLHLFGETEIPLELNGRGWLPEPRSIRWSPTLERDGIEPGDRLDRLRPRSDKMCTSLVPGLGADLSPPNRLAPSAPLGTARSLPLLQRRYVAELVRKVTDLPKGVRSALATFIEEDQGRPSSEKSILFSKPVWVVPLPTPLPAAVLAGDTDTTVAQMERSTLVLVVEPRLPQNHLLTMPNELVGVLMRSATYNSHVDALGNHLLHSDTEAQASTIVATSHAGDGIGGSVCPLAPISAEPDSVLDPRRSTEAIDQDHQALLLAQGIAKRINVELPRPPVATQGRRPNGGSAAPRLRTGPFMLPGEMERWSARVATSLTSDLFMRAHSFLGEVNSCRTQRHEVAEKVAEKSVLTSELKRRAASRRRDLRTAQNEASDVQDDIEAVREKLEKEKRSLEAELDEVRAQQAQALAEAKANTDRLRHLLADLSAQNRLTDERRPIAEVLLHQGPAQAAQDEDEEMADELAGLAEEASAYT